MKIISTIVIARTLQRGIGTRLAALYLQREGISLGTALYNLTRGQK